MAKTENDQEKKHTKSYVVYIDTPAAQGGIRLGKMLKYDHEEAVTFCYTRLDGTAFAQDFKSEGGMYRWLKYYFMNEGNFFRDATLNLKIQAEVC